jgi:hypothetical protein
MIGKAKKLKPGSRMDIVTPIGTARIRGTVWMFTVTPTPGSGGTSFQGKLDVAEGQVDFSKTDSSATVQVQGGYTATFDATISPTGEVRISNINTSPMPPERQAMLLSTVSNVAQQQTFFTAVSGTPDALREAIAQAQQSQGEGANQPADANPNQIGISDLPPVIQPNPPQPPPPAPTPTPAPTPAPPTPPSPATTPKPTPAPTPPTPWTLEDLFQALNQASDQVILTSLNLQPDQLERAKNLFKKITPEQFEDWTGDYFSKNHSEVDLTEDFKNLGIASLSDFGRLIDDISLNREDFIQFIESNANPMPTPPPTPTPIPSNG